MASSKRRRKQAALDRKERLGGIGTGARPNRHRDGDRRRRHVGGMVRDALARKRAVRDWTIDSDLPLDPPFD